MYSLDQTDDFCSNIIINMISETSIQGELSPIIWHQKEIKIKLEETQMSTFTKQNF